MYVRFSSSTSGYFEYHYIHSWSFFTRGLLASPHTSPRAKKIKFHWILFIFCLFSSHKCNTHSDFFLLLQNETTKRSPCNGVNWPLWVILIDLFARNWTLQPKVSIQRKCLGMEGLEVCIKTPYVTQVLLWPWKNCSWFISMWTWIQCKSLHNYLNKTSQLGMLIRMVLWARSMHACVWLHAQQNAW